MQMMVFVKEIFIAGYFDAFFKPLSPLLISPIFSLGFIVQIISRTEIYFEKKRKTFLFDETIEGFFNIQKYPNNFRLPIPVITKMNQVICSHRPILKFTRQL